ncbi:Crotonobetaine/carnitine--CoA ligase [Streptomyces alboniger]
MSGHETHSRSQGTSGPPHEGAAGGASYSHRPDGLSYTHGTGDTALLGDTIGANLDRAVAAWPEREALVDVPSGRRWTYARFAADVDRLASALLASGVVKGDRVGIWAVNCPEWVLVQYATARIGAIMVNINPAYRTHEVEYVLQQAGISLLFASLSHKSSDYRAMVDQVRGRCPQLREVAYFGDPSWEALIGRATPEARYEDLSCDDPINIQYTSGTTGFPKGATLSHHNILNNGYFVGELVGYSEQDRDLCPGALLPRFGMVMGNPGRDLARRLHGHPRPLLRPRGHPARGPAGELHLPVRRPHHVHRGVEPP